MAKTKSKATSKRKVLKVKLTRELSKGDTVVYTKQGRFKLSDKGKITLDTGDKKLKANYA